MSNRNTGDCNTGHCNTGDWNTGDWNTGFFCVETPRAIFFDLPCDMSHDETRGLIPAIDLPVGTEWVSSKNMSDAEKAENPNYAVIGGYLKKHELPLTKSFPMAWAKMDNETRRKFIELPNFDAEKFLQITGVDVRTNIDIQRRINDLEAQLTELKKEFTKEPAPLTE